MHWIKLGNSYENLDNVVRVVKEYDEEDEVTMLRVESADRLWIIRDPEQMEKLLRSLGALCVEDAGSSANSGREELLTPAEERVYSFLDDRELATLRLELKPPHSGTGVPADKSFQSKITAEAAERTLQSIY